jgi:hypothetical protein
MKTKYKPRLVAYVSVGNVNEQERDELVQMWAFLLERDGVDARGRDEGRRSKSRACSANGEICCASFEFSQGVMPAHAMFSK